jgi:ubiquinone/menaquinone biosynthesis C-methylase UbiE
MPANYNKIARIYDLLSGLVFAGCIKKSQDDLVIHITPNSKVLIAGGGTGWILEKIAKQYTEGLIIDYVEVSSEMMVLSQKRDCKMNQVNFIQLPIEDFILEKQYDVIITPFMLDNFRHKKLDLIFKKLNKGLKPGGLWLYADFIYDKNRSPLWQQILLKIMYLFFRLTSDIETQELVDTEGYFAGIYRIEFEKLYYFKFIRSAVYRKV